MRTRRYRAGLLAAVLVLFAACGDDGSGPSVDPETVTVNGGAGQTGTVGEELAVEISVLVTGTDGNPFEDAPVVWAVFPGHGTVNPASSRTNAQGIATTRWTLGPTAGMQNIAATVGTLPSVTVSATATPGPAASVAVTPEAPTIDALEGTVQLEAELRDEFDNAVEGGTFTWASGDDAIATVDAASGEVTGLQVGAVTITVTDSDSDLEGEVTLTVQQVAAAIDISPDDPQLAVATTVQLAAAVTDANGFAIPDAEVTWSSQAETIATVDENGLLSGVTEGTARILAVSGEARDSVDAVVVLTADDFEPAQDTEISGSMTVGRLSIPAGVTVTATSDVVINALEEVEIAGTLTGDCVAITVNGRTTATYTGTVRNTCTAENADDLPDIQLVNDGALTITGATFEYAGDLDIKNNPAVGDADFEDLETSAARSSRRRVRAENAASAAAQGGVCAVTGGSFMPSAPSAREGIAGSTLGGNGGSAGGVTLTCDGDLDIGGGSSVDARDGGDGGDALNDDPASDDGTGRGGNGGNGGPLRVRSTGNMNLAGTTLNLSSGGNGGDATVLGADPGGDATAEGGAGGDGGNTFVSAGGNITIQPGGLTIVVGNGGNGGEAIANAGNGKNADATAATDGGDAMATGGAGGHSVAGRLRARGSVTGLENADVTGGDGGMGGEATAVGGRGGNGNLEFKDGANGGSMEARGGNGGMARTKDITGTVTGVSGDGGNIRIVGGRGGDGADRCSIPDTGGNGGNGGAARGGPGAGGEGDNPGLPGMTTVAAAVANGGNGDDGTVAGTAGTAGPDELDADPNRVDEGDNFEDGNPGEICPIALDVDLEVSSDPNGHDPFLGLSSVGELIIEFGAEGTVLINGPTPWVPLSGTIDAEGNITASGSGTLAGFPGVPVTFTGTLVDGMLQGTLTVDPDRQVLPADGGGVRNSTVYQVTGTMQ